MHHTCRFLDHQTARCGRILQGKLKTHITHRQIVPTLCVGTHPVTLCVSLTVNAERPDRHSHAERGNDHILRVTQDLSPSVRAGMLFGCFFQSGAGVVFTIVARAVT